MIATLGTALLVSSGNEDLYTATIRAFELGFMMGRHDKRYTVKIAAGEFDLSPSGAYRLLSRSSGSHRVMVVEDNGEWFVPREIDGKDWPY